MTAKHARHIALTAPFTAWVDELVARGDYTSASDLVRTALRQMQEREGKTVHHIKPNEINLLEVQLRV